LGGGKGSNGESKLTWRKKGVKGLIVWGEKKKNPKDWRKGKITMTSSDEKRGAFRKV